MSKFTANAVKPGLSQKHKAQAVTNYMDGTSYELDPISTLRIVTTSSIFGEPQYYVDGDSSPAVLRTRLSEYALFTEMFASSKTTGELMEKVIDDALSFNYDEALKFISELRNTYWMRTNPAVAMVRAAMHENRHEFTQRNPSKFSEILAEVARRPDDLTTMVEYYISVLGSKALMPNILKRAIRSRLEKYDRYQLSKHANKGIGLTDVIRIVRARSKVNPLIKELLETGKVEAPAGKETWRTLRSAGKSWKEIFEVTYMTPEDILFNLRGIFTEVSDITFAKSVLNALEQKVVGAKIFPYRFWVASNILSNSSGVNHLPVILDSLEKCLDLAIQDMPKLSGRVICLSDNSGSAWGGFTFEGASTKVAEIDNLSSVITGMTSDEGYVGIFGDKLEIHPVSKRNGALSQVTTLNKRYNGSANIGGGTENGIWLFFDQAIRNSEHWDTVFIYSDMQAGHGGLYGLDAKAYHDYQYQNTRNIDVLKLVEDYRKKVNSKLNVFSVQTAGYNNSVIPEHIYRGAVLSGWTGKESIFANALIQEWDLVERKRSNTQQ